MHYQERCEKTSIICSVHIVAEAKILRFPYPFKNFNLRNRYLFNIYLQFEKGALFGRSLPIEGRTYSSPRGFRLGKFVN